MTIERATRILAGSFILLSLGLAHLSGDLSLTAGPTWAWFTLFVGANLLQSGLTQWCPAEVLLAKLGLKHACDPAA